MNKPLLSIVTCLVVVGVTGRTTYAVDSDDELTIQPPVENHEISTSLIDHLNKTWNSSLDHLLNNIHEPPSNDDIRTSLILPIDKKKHECDQCEYTTNRINDLTRHQIRKHTDKRAYKCDLCEYAAKIQCDLNKHRKFKHPTKENSARSQFIPYGFPFS